MKIEEKYSNGLLDFHTHSIESDGGDTPTELVERAKKNGVSAMALTDHNVISGLEEFRAACKNKDIFAIPFGTEIYAELPLNIQQKGDNETPDLVVLGKNPKNINDGMRDYHNILIKDWTERFFPQTISNLEKMGFKLSREIINAKTVGELNMFMESLKRKLCGGTNLYVLINHVLSINKSASREDIEKEPVRYINRYIFAIGQPGYVKRLEGFKVKDAIMLTKDINCKLFIAHPGGKYGFLSDKVFDYYIKEGVNGIETRNYFNTPKQNKKFDELAEKYNLIKSGGSDCHGNNGPFKIGMCNRPRNQVPKEVLEELLNNLP